jgi:hypothetical protein
LDEDVGLGDILVGDAGSGLVEDGALGSLEDDVVAGIAFLQLGFDFAVEIVFFVFGFPVAVGEVEGVEERAVDADGGVLAFDLEFWDEGEFELASTGGEQVLEGAADGHFVAYVELAELMEGVVIGADGRVRGLEI